MIQASTTVVFIALLVISYPDIGWASAHNPSTSWANTVDLGHKLRATTLQFYFHDTISGDSPTVFLVAPPNTSHSSALAFGNLFMFDAPLTVGPARKSNLVGRAQGMYASDSREDVAVFMSMSFTFTQGVYNGSSISIVGHNPITHLKRELPVLGGTGIFRLGRGYALPRAYKSDLVTGNAIVGYNVTVFHLDHQAFSDDSSVIHMMFL